MPPKVSIVVFAKDEENTLGEVLGAVKGKASELIVMDGHSKDRTPEIALSHGAKLLCDSGRGKGAAQREAIEAVSGDIVVFMDADGSDDVAQWDALVAPIIEGRADMVIGSRYSGGSDEISVNFMQLFRTAGNIFINSVINWRWDANLTDTLNCYRAIKTEVARGLGLVESSAAVEHEMVMKCLKRGFRVVNVPTHEYARKYGVSKISPWKIGHRFFLCLLKNIF
ncbi:MAG: glycosyltransferase [Elusimicrobia bacterium]|nr:glycosyltransferase [Elusimicrobiota bacterium]